MAVTPPGPFPRSALKPARCRLADGQWEEGPDVALPVAYNASGEWYPLWGIQFPEIVSKVAVFFHGFDGSATNVDFAYVYGDGEGGGQTYAVAGKLTATGTGQVGLVFQVGGRLARWFGVSGRVTDNSGALKTKVRLRALATRAEGSPVEDLYGPDITKL